MEHVGKSVIEIPLKQIFIPENRRRTFDKNNPRLMHFVHYLGKTGMINAINVRKVKDDQYELLIGRRRFWAAKQLGWPTIPCVIEKWTDAEIEWVRLCENLHRSHMSKTEEIRANQKLLAEF